MEGRYEDSNILFLESMEVEKVTYGGGVMKAVTFYFQNLERTPCLYRFGLAFLQFKVDLTFTARS